MKLHRRCANARGFSLVELMVGIAISLVVTLVIFSVLSLSESRKRTSTSVNDINQSGAYGMYMLDAAIRSAGSGFSSAWADTFGCTLNASVGGSVRLPRVTPFPVPFAGVDTTLRLAPVVVGQGQSATGSDVLLVMAGTAGFGESVFRAKSESSGSSVTGSQTQVQLQTIPIGVRLGDLVLVGQRAGSDCLVSQVLSNPTNIAAADGSFPLMLGNASAGTAASFYSSVGANINMSSLVASSGSLDTYVVALGNVQRVGGVATAPARNPPQFRMYGVGADQTLFGYDLFNVDGTDAAVPVLDGVVELHAVYGVDNKPVANGIFSDWVAPTGVAWGAAALLDGTPQSQERLRRIVAIRLVLVMRTALPEKADVAAPINLPYFSDLGALAATYSVPAAARNYRYRIVESTIPLRNSLVQP